MNPILKKILAGGNLVDALRQILDEVITTKEERATLEANIQALLQAHEQAILNTVVDDRKSARQREVEVMRAGTRNLTQHVLAYGAVVAFFALTFYIIAKGLGSMHTEESFIIGNLTGMAAAIAKDIYGYYFGSSRGEVDARTRNSAKKG